MKIGRWKPVTPTEPPLYEPVILCRIRDGKLVSEAGIREAGGGWKVYGSKIKRVLCWQPMPEPPAAWNGWINSEEGKE